MQPIPPPRSDEAEFQAALQAEDDLGMGCIDEVYFVDSRHVSECGRID